MLSNLHTHSSFCDGKNTPEEIVLSALENGFDSVGFSSHGYTRFDLRYCMKNTDGYIAEINRLKSVYKHKIQIYLGVEEDAFHPSDRGCYDYIIGSSHYFESGGVYYPIDSNYEYFQKCLKLFDYDILSMSTVYYERFCEYIMRRKPDIVGHFDLITKFDETDTPRFLCNEKYHNIAERYITQVAVCDVLFEVNTGAISRGLRTSVYPHQRLLHILRKQGRGVILSSDSHVVDTLGFGFDEAKAMLKDVGFDGVYVLYDGEFKKELF